MIRLDRDMLQIRAERQDKWGNRSEFMQEKT